jgi:hypothetical protein
MLAASEHALVDNAQNEHRTWGVDFSLMPETPATLHFCRTDDPVELNEERESPTCTSCLPSSSTTKQGWIVLFLLIIFMVYQD